MRCGTRPLLRTVAALVAAFSLGACSTTAGIPSAVGTNAGIRPLPDGPVYGVTTDDGYDTAALVAGAENLSRRPTTRIVFDEKVPARSYAGTVGALREHSWLMGLLADSYVMKNYTDAQFQRRTDEYLTTLGSKVDSWEIGNEVNGEWLGATADTVSKITGAFDKAEKRGYRTALTLYYNPDCWEKPANEMFRWATENIPARMKGKLDYVWISYYEQDCENQRFDNEHWNTVFDRLHAMFPNSKVGFGEVGARPESSPAYKADHLRRYYGMAVNTPGFVGGYFWWYYHTDCLPWDRKPLWKVLDHELTTY